jgi:hypothetical protein
MASTKCRRHSSRASVTRSSVDGIGGDFDFPERLSFQCLHRSGVSQGRLQCGWFNWDFPNTPAFVNHFSVSRGAFIAGLFPASAFPVPVSRHQGNLGQLPAEMFTLLNHVNLTNPVSDLSNSLFGKSTGQNLPARLHSESGSSTITICAGCHSRCFTWRYRLLRKRNRSPIVI